MFCLLPSLLSLENHRLIEDFLYYIITKEKKAVLVEDFNANFVNHHTESSIG